MRFREIVHSLGLWGYLDVNAVGNLIRNVWKEDGDIFRGAVRTFQERWGAKYDLPTDGKLDDDTVELMSRRFCSCPDQMSEPEENRANLQRWGGNRITWQDQGVRVGSLSFADAMAFTISQVKGACNMTIVQTTDRGNIYSVSRRIDGPGGTLAQAYLPGRPSHLGASLKQEYDTSESRLSQHDYNLVTLHESCHSLGLSHDQTNETALMDPFLNSRLDGLQSADKRQLILRYGEPTSTGLPDPPPEPPSNPGDPSFEFKVTQTESGLVLEIPGYRVTKL